MAKTFMTINTEGLTSFAQEIFTTVDSKITETSAKTIETVEDSLTDRLTNVIDKDSTMDQIPTAVAVYNALQVLAPALKNTETVVGPIDDVSEPSTTTMYLQKDSEDDPSWSIYLYINNAWVQIGDTEIDLSGYVEKTDAETVKSLVEIDKYLEKTDADTVKALVDYDSLLKDASQFVTPEQLDTTIADAIADDTTTVKVDSLATSIADLVKTDAELKAALVEALKDDFVTPDQVTEITDQQIKDAVAGATGE